MTVANPFHVITGPFKACPSCGAPRFGVLAVYPAHLARRCRMCGFPQRGEPTSTERLPPLSKRVLYLDQSYWSNLVHQAAPTLDPSKCLATEAWGPTLERLEALVGAQVLVCPTSGFHLDETMPILHLDDLNRALDGLQARLSCGVGFPDAIDVEITQLRAYARAWQDRDPVDQVELPALRYHGDLNGWCPRYIVGVATSSFYRGIAGDITVDVQRHGSGLVQAFESWRTAEPFTRDAHYQYELESYQQAMLEAVRDGAWQVRLRFMAIASELGGGDREAGMKPAVRFLASEASTRTPSIRIAAAIYTVIAYDANTGGLTSIRPSTDMDLRIVSTLAPYCDAMTVDQQFGALLRKPPARQAVEAHTTTVLASRRELDDYLDHLASVVTDGHLQLVASVYGEEPVDRFRSIFGRPS